MSVPSESNLEAALVAELTALSKGDTDMSAGLVYVETERGLRGKGNEGKKVKFQAISEAEPRPANVIDAALEAVNHDQQAFWESFVYGFNERAYEAVADPIAEFIDASWDADKTKNFRMSVNAMAKFLQKDKAEIAQALLAEIKGE